MKKKVYTLLLTTALTIGFLTLAYAESNYLSDFRTRYGSGITIDNCGLCHPGGNTGRRNQFALDYANPSIGNYYFGTSGSPNTTIDNRDSDGDGITNINEINARTSPGSITLQLSSATYSVNENGGSVTITVTRTGGSDFTLGVSYAASNGTAASGSDYTSASGALSWTNGDTSSKTFSVPILDDILYEGNETVNLTLTSPTNGATLGSPSTAVLTIVDNDSVSQPGNLQLSAATYSANENGGSATITVTRTGGSSGAVGISYSTSNGTATAGSDYTSASGTLSWANGDTANKTFSVPIANDPLDEANETLAVTLSSPTGGATLGSLSSATLTITDDDPAPTVQLSAGSSSGNEATTPASIAVTLSAASGQTVTVNYATANGTATAGSDYTAASGTLTFNPGMTNQTISVPIIDDTTVEGNETFTVTLSGPVNATLGSTTTHTYTINNDDNAGTLQFSAAAYSVNENGGSATITVTRTGGGSGAVGVSYSTSDGTAASGSDYTSASGTLSWPNGDTANKTFSVPITNDSISGEANETVNLALSSLTGGASLGSPSTAVLTIIDTTPTPAGTLQFSATAYSVNENGGSATITVTRTGGSGGAVGVSYSTSNGTATAGSDYTSASGTLSWANGDTANKTFSVPITNDSSYEVNETVNLTLSSVTGGATLGSTNTAALTIISEDPAPPTVNIVATDNTAAEIPFNTGYYTVSRTGSTTGALTVNYSVSGSATAGSDYTPLSGNVTIPAGSSTASIAVAPVDDAFVEGDETVIITLSANAAYSIGSSSSATIVISSEDRGLLVDFDGDGKTDIVWRHRTNGLNTVWLMDGTNWLSSVWLSGVSDVNWEIVGIGDFNNDSKPDMVWRHKTDGSNAVWLMNGTTWSSSVLLPGLADVNWEIVGVGDFNNDSKPDMVWRNKTDGINAVWLMDGTSWLSSAWLPTIADVNWEIVGIGDFNNDSKPDIVWRHKTDGSNTVWLMDGTTWSSSVWLPGVADTDWEIVGP